MLFEITEMFAGGGTLLHALKKGLERGGAAVRVAGLVELEPKYLQYSARAHPSASTWNGSAAAWHPAEISSPSEGGLKLLSAGIPCTGSSRCGIAKRHLSCPEEHPDVGALFLAVLHYVRCHKPDFIVLECVDSYRNTLSVRCIRDALSATGYKFDERVINPLKDFESPSQRKRWVLVAAKHGHFRWLYEAKPFNGTLASYLDPEGPEDAVDSATPEQVQADEKYVARKKAEGCGFFRGRKFLDHSSTRCGTIPKTYGRRQPNGIFVRTVQSYRPIRPREVARIHGFEDLFPDAPKTVQYELYGQGVLANPFISLGEHIAKFAKGEYPAHWAQMELFSA